MATTITAEEIKHLASLSALQLTDEEVAHYQHDLEAILPYVSQLQEIDTTGVEPLLHPIPGAQSPLTHGVSPYADPDWLLTNVQHPIQHRHIVIAPGQTAGDE